MDNISEKALKKVGREKIKFNAIRLFTSVTAGMAKFAVSTISVYGEKYGSKNL